MTTRRQRERAVKTSTLDQRDKARQAVAQKPPWKLSELHKFDKGLHLGDKGQYPKR